MGLPKDNFFRDEAMKSGMAHDGIDRFFHGYRQPQNPYQTEYANYYQASLPVQPVQPYGVINNGYGLKLGVAGPGIYAADHIPAAFSPGEYMSQSPYGHSYGGNNHGGGGHTHHRSKSKNTSLNALTLLAFLFFINVLQNCLKEQMSALNPTVMVMTAGTSRLQKTKTEPNQATEPDPSKELNDDFDGHKLSGTGGNFEELTNDQGDVFYRPTLTISSKLSSTFEGQLFNETIKN